MGELGAPFKRYHMGPVWRGENTAHGRYREFWQCDFDTIGTTANAADIEVALVIHDLMIALGFERFQVRINNRLILNGLLEELGLDNEAVTILRALDKLPKVGPEKVIEEMTRTGTGEGNPPGVTRSQAERVLALVQTQGANTEILDRLQHDFGGNARAASGIRYLREMLDVARCAGVEEERLHLDLSIARGLDYYTGTIYETFLMDLPDIGSICSGGRYDNLAGLYTRQKLPGVGASLGLDRLLTAMEELHLLPRASTPAAVLVVQFAADRLGDYEKMARALRTEGLGVEVYPEARRVGQQLQYAVRRGYRVALIAGPDEFAQGAWNVKDLAAGVQQEKVRTAEVPALIRSILEAPRIC
jgi:histidyl-tRNA synthetase